MPDKLSWTDVEDIGLELADRHPDTDPIAVRFTELRALVEALDNFEPQPDQHVNEQILEAIQQAWKDEADDVERDEDEGYRPPTAYRPEQ